MRQHLLFQLCQCCIKPGSPAEAYPARREGPSEDRPQEHGLLLDCLHNMLKAVPCGYAQAFSTHWFTAATGRCSTSYCIAPG